MYPETSEIRFLYKGNTYGRFKLLEGDPIAFQVTNNIILNHAMPFIADCYDDPTNKPESSRTSDDLRFGQGIFTQPIKEALGFSVVLNPPGTKMHKIHPLHKDLRTALNKSRTLRASQEELVASLKGINAHHTMKKLKNP